MPAVPLNLNSPDELVDSNMQINPVFPDYTRIPMKKNMNNKWKMLTLTAMLSATTATAADTTYDEDAYFAETSDYVGSLYDNNDQASPAPVENVPVLNDDVYFNEVAYQDNVAPNAYNSNLAPVAYVGDEAAYMSPNVGSGIAASPASYSSDCGCGDTACGGGSSCSTGNCGTPRRTVRRKQRSLLAGADAWMTAEALLWFPQARSTPALVATNDAGIVPDLSTGSTVQFGGDDAFGGDELAAGFRLDGGLFLTEDFGVGGRFWWLSEQSDSYANAGDGSTESIGVPFFDSAVGQEATLFTAFDDGVGTLANFTGSVSAESTLEMYAAEAYGRLRLLGGKGYRTDLVGGFSHFGIDEGLTLNMTAEQTEDIGGAGNGDTFTYADSIEAENRFYGGQIGFLTSVGQKAWSLTALTKVHLGDMEQNFTYNGTRTRTPAPAGTLAGGIFAPEGDNTNVSWSENNFSFVPEANLKLALKLRPHVRFTVGYSFLMFSDVATVGDNMNRVVSSEYVVQDDIGTTNTPDRPSSDGLESDSFFVHGLDLGAVIEF